MKKATLVLLGTILSIALTACQTGTGEQSGSAPANSSSVSEEQLSSWDVSASGEEMSVSSFTGDEQNNSSTEVLCRLPSRPPVRKPTSSESGEGDSSTEDFGNKLFIEKKPQYKYSNEIFPNLGDFIQWINESDPKTYKDGQFRTMLEPIQQDGYIYVPYYKNQLIPGCSSPNGWEKDLVCTRYESDGEGHGYSYYCEMNDRNILVNIYYLDPDEAQDAKENLHNYRSGVGVKTLEYQKSWEEAKAEGMEKHTIPNFQGDAITSDTGDGRTQTWFLYQDKVIIRIIIPDEAGITSEEFIKDLTFKKVSLR